MVRVVEEKKRVKKGFHKSGISYIRNGKRYKVFITYAQQQTLEQLLLLMTIHFDLPEIISHTHTFYGIRIDCLMCMCVCVCSANCRLFHVFCFVASMAIYPSESKIYSGISAIITCFDNIIALTNHSMRKKKKNGAQERYRYNQESE